MFDSVTNKELKTLIPISKGQSVLPCDHLAGLADGLRASAKSLRNQADALDRRAVILEDLSKQV